MIQLFSCIIFMVAFTISTTQQAPDQYLDTKFNRTMGIYFERVDPLQHITGMWRAMVFLEVDKSKKYLTSCEEKLKIALDTCKKAKMLECEKILNYERLSQKYKLTKNLQEILDNTIEDLRYHTQIHSYHTANNRSPSIMKRNRRNLPWFGVVGKIAGPAFGVLNYEDGERYDEAIKDLNEHQRNISRLMGEQAHIIRSELYRLHEREELRDKELDSINQNLSKFTEKLSDITRFTTNMNFRFKLEEFVLKMELTFDEHQRSLNQIIEILRSAQDGKLHPALLSREQLLTMAREVYEQLPAMEFPTNPQRVNIMDLVRVSTVSIRLHGNKLFAALDVPLLEREQFQLYQLHTLPVNQSTINNLTTRAYIVPIDKFLATDDNKRRYSFWSESDIQKCIRSNGKRMCQSIRPIYDSSIVPSCEIELLKIVKPAKDVLKTCNIRLSLNQQPFWTALSTLGGWLYSLMESEVAYITCNGNAAQEAKLEGTGILQLSKGCTLKTDSVSLMTPKIQDDPHEYIYLPPFNLNVTDVLPNFSEIQELGIFHQQIPISKHTTTWNSKASDATLMDLENQWKLLSQHEISTKRSTNLSKTALGSCGLLAIIIIIFLLRNVFLEMFRSVRIFISKKRMHSKAPPTIIYDLPRVRQFQRSKSLH
ncbi:uncharacterized protein LOC127277608 [Leptopilina boulardi]|uniref:uncharacterized protein LOC127277608 n=1 Tax=Leptopilina boulardi TaxID=63433 RepID=UPI0021F5AA18|nr:uncharacterized protein LOC127277608 [Leptopilina boulardi]